MQQKLEQILGADQKEGGLWEREWFQSGLHTSCCQFNRNLTVFITLFFVAASRKGFYDEAVVLLNKAIKGEKNEKGLYINRGGIY